MLAAIKMEVMTPAKEAPDEGCVAIDFHMPPICSPIVRPGRPAEVAHVASKQLSETIIRQDFDIIFHIQELITFETVASYYADGALIDTALLATVAAFLPL
ncbi:hypothetical protein L2E82_18364 [Cichorium intybus]|uniref:Uncharacterized protein n=1 Tax=Cichorium intybus TaxID=13427 RepID=A0ACB9FAG7_CICIN|nr:hypothetical protein L2E82_18364 [Cichorium intybus]